MSHLSLMTRQNQTEFAVFKLWMLYFQRIFPDLFIAQKQEKSKINSLPVSFYCRKRQSSRPFLTIIAKLYIS